MFGKDVGEDMGVSINSLGGEPGLAKSTGSSGERRLSRIDSSPSEISSSVRAEFLDKLSLHAKREVILLTFVSSPMSWLSPFWELIYNEQRIELPGIKELVNVLWEMNIFPDIEMITPSYVSEWLEHSPEGEVRPRTYLNLQEAVEHIAPRLFISLGSPQEKILTDAILKLMPGDNGLRMNSEKISQRVAIIRWRT